MAVLSRFLLYIDAGRQSGHESCYAVLWVYVDIDLLIMCRRESSIVEVLLLAVVISMPCEFDQYISQVLFFCVTVVWARKKKNFSIWKIHVKSRASDRGPGLGSWFDSVMQFHLYNWQKHMVIQNLDFFFPFLSQPAHIEKSQENQSTDLFCICLQVMMQPIMKLSLVHFWSSRECVENVALLLKWSCFQNFITSKSLYLFHTLTIVLCTAADCFKKPIKHKESLGISL